MDGKTYKGLVGFDQCAFIKEQMVQGDANVLSSVSRCGEVEARVTYGALGHIMCD